MSTWWKGLDWGDVAGTKASRSIESPSLMFEQISLGVDYGSVSLIMSS